MMSSHGRAANWQCKRRARQSQPFHQLRNAQLQCDRNPLDISQRQVAFAALDAAHVSAIKAACGCERVLRVSLLAAQGANPLAKPLQDVSLPDHLPKLRPLMTIRRRIMSIILEQPAVRSAVIYFRLLRNRRLVHRQRMGEGFVSCAVPNRPRLPDNSFPIGGDRPTVESAAARSWPDGFESQA